MKPTEHSSNTKTRRIKNSWLKKGKNATKIKGTERIIQENLLKTIMVQLESNNI